MQHIGKVLAGIGILTLIYTVGTRAQEGRRSPHETAEVTLAGKQVTITYGRPSIHNRKIMGELVPYGKVWRTGADEATTLDSPIDLSISGTALPAGKYTLWTLPSDGAWKLIINKETGQWGTHYDPSQDLARVSIQKSRIEQPVDEFTISWTKKGEHAAELEMEWENTRVSVPVRAK